MTEQTQDPYAAAMAAKERPPIYWGNLMTEAFFAVLEKGIGKVPYDVQTHPPGRRVTAISLSLLTIPEQGLNYPIEREFVAEFGEWIRFVLPSLKELGVVDLQELNDKFVKIMLIPTGKMYKVKDPATGDFTGEVRPEQTWKFLKVFADEQECTADYLSGENGDEPEPEAQAAVPAAQPQGGNGDGRDPEKETALVFLKVLIENATNGQTDIKVIQETLAASFETTPLVGNHFTVDSPEVTELIMEAMNA